MAQSPAFRGFAIFALCWIAPSLALFAYAQDLGDAGDGDLSTVSQRLPADRNALTTLAKAAQNLDYPDDYIEAADRIDLAIVGVAWDSDWVSDVLANNATALAHFERAIETRAFQIRVRSTYGEERALGDWLMLAKLRALETRVQGLRGDGEDALGAALALAQFGTRIRELDGGRMRHYLTGTSIIRIASTAMQRILKDVPIALPQAKEFVRSLEELRLHRDGWARVAIGEYQWRRGVLDEVVTARAGDGKRLSRDPFARDVLDSMVSLTPTGYSLQRNRTLRRLAGHYRTSVAQVPSACLELSQQKPEGGGLPPTPGAYSVGRNALGDYWADLARTSIRAHRITDCVSQSLLSAVQVMVALRAFEGENGQMPGKLAELVPAYFDAVPLDYFDGNPIRYSPNRHLLYSVGSDLADARGQWHPGQPCNSELSFRIPFATVEHGTVEPLLTTCAVSRS